MVCSRYGSGYYCVKIPLPWAKHVALLLSPTAGHLQHGHALLVHWIATCFSFSVFCRNSTEKPTFCFSKLYIQRALARNWDAKLVVFSIVNFQHAFLLLWCHWDTYRVPFPPTFNTLSGRISIYCCEILLLGSNPFLALSVYWVFHLTSICSVDIHPCTGS